VKIGRFQIVVMMMHVPVTGTGMLILLLVMPVLVHAQYEYAESVYHQPEYRNENGLVVDNFYRMEKPFQAFPAHDKGKQGQQNGSAKAAEGIHLAGAETEIRIMRVTSSIDVCEGIDAECGRVRCHVESVGQQRHRSEQDARNDLNHHHRAGDGNDNECAQFAWSLPVLTEGVTVPPALVIVTLHCFRFHTPLIRWKLSARQPADFINIPRLVHSVTTPAYPVSGTPRIPVTSHGMNPIMKLLTMIRIIFLPPGLPLGIDGMYFGN
jgi:hypothetical protein